MFLSMRYQKSLWPKTCHIGKILLSKYWFDDIELLDTFTCSWDSKVLLNGIFFQLSYPNPCSITPIQSKYFELTDLTKTSDTLLSHPRSSVARVLPDAHCSAQRPSTTQSHTSWSGTGPSSCTIKAPSTLVVIHIPLEQLTEGKKFIDPRCLWN